ncbi:M20 family metallopeptidase [Caballeronia glebae]|uniref:M20 family metallopeptidase n=1 Tax=Caballeronia glebae TaxID=1777143 RepID=UPI0038BD3EA5
MSSEAVVPNHVQESLGRQRVIESAAAHFESGSFSKELERRVMARTESQRLGSGPDLLAYLNDEMSPLLNSLGFECETWSNPIDGAPPFLFAARIENESAPTVLMYGHGDVVRGDDSNWAAGLEPWRVREVADRLYGRGTADNKGQHSVNLASLTLVMRERQGRLGFNVKLLMEMGEEVGSPGLEEIVELHQNDLRAHVLVASDGPRVDAETPTLFLGSRGFVNFTLSVQCRERSYHSGNWGGLLTNPAVRLTNALATLVNERGAIQVPQLTPGCIPEDVRDRLAELSLQGRPGDPEINDRWGEDGLTRTEKLYGWNSFEVLAITAGNPVAPVNAIPPSATAHCQLRFVVGTDWRNLEALLRHHFDRLDYQDVLISVGDKSPATRLNPDNWWVKFVEQSAETTLGKKPAILPNIGGSIPNHVFSETLRLPTVWIPHSYPGCAQHAPDEHMLADVAREGLRLMAGLWWDLNGANPER